MSPLPRQQQRDALQPAEELAEHLNPRPCPGHLAQRRAQYQGGDARRGDHRQRPVARIEAAAVSDHVRRKRGEGGGQRGPCRGETGALPGVGDPGEQEPFAGVVQFDQLRPQPPGGGVGAAARVEREAEQAAGGRHVAGEEPGQDVAPAGVAFGEDDLGRPAKRKG